MGCRIFVPPYRGRITRGRLWSRRGTPAWRNDVSRRTVMVRFRRVPGGSGCYARRPGECKSPLRGHRARPFCQRQRLEWPPLQDAVEQLSCPSTQVERFLPHGLPSLPSPQASLAHQRRGSECVGRWLIVGDGRRLGYLRSGLPALLQLLIVEADLIAGHGARQPGRVNGRQGRLAPAGGMIPGQDLLHGLGRGAGRPQEDRQTETGASFSSHVAPFSAARLSRPPRQPTQTLVDGCSGLAKGAGLASLEDTTEGIGGLLRSGGEGICPRILLRGSPRCRRNAKRHDRAPSILRGGV